MSFCSAEQIDQFNPSINCVVKFLNKLLQDGLGYSAINTAKSAISSAVSVVNNINIGIHPLIKKFMKGVYNCKPTLPRQSATWDVSLVLRYLKSLYPHGNLSLKQLSYKLIVLLALTTGQRIQTLHSVDLKNVVLSPNFIKIRIGELLKQTKVGQHLTELYIEEYKQDKAICVVEAFHAYVEKTKMLRGDYSQLFIGLQKPHTPVTKSTLARWIKAVLVSSCIDMSMYTPHSTRSASTSVAALKIPIVSVLKTAGWKKDCVFRKFYQREVTNNSEFSNAVLGHLQ